MLEFLLGTVALIEEVGAAAPTIEALAGVIESGGVLALIRGLSVTQWLEVVAKVAAAAPEIQKAWAALHPAFDEVLADLKNDLDRHDVAANARAWFQQNVPATIPGYDAAGALTDVPNPDQETAK